MRPSTPFTKRGESSSPPKPLASSTASLMETDTGTSSQWNISKTARRRMERSTMGMRESAQFSDAASTRSSTSAWFASTPWMSARA